MAFRSFTHALLGLAYQLQELLSGYAGHKMLWIQEWRWPG